MKNITFGNITFGWMVLLAALVVVGGCTVDVREDPCAAGYSLTCTVPAAATSATLKHNFTGGWETETSVLGRTVSWCGALDSDTLASPACTRDAEGQRCGYVSDVEFDAWPWHCVTEQDGRLVESCTCSVQGPTPTRLTPVSNGDGGGNEHWRSAVN